MKMKCYILVLNIIILNILHYNIYKGLKWTKKIIVYQFYAKIIKQQLIFLILWDSTWMNHKKVMAVLE